MASGIPGAQNRTINYGVKVERATAVLPATTTANIFIVNNGRIIVKGLIGLFTTAASATATNLKVRSNPTLGTAVDLCANALVTSAVAGTQVSLPALRSSALDVSSGSAFVLDSPGVVVPAGAIQLTTDATNTGSVRWTLLYIPLDDGSSVTAV